MRVLAFLFLLSINIQAKSLGSHVHGVASLDVATDNKTLLLILKAPSDIIFGFEHKAKSEEDKATVKKEKKKWESDVVSYLGKTALKDCKHDKTEWRQAFSSDSHSNLVIESYIQCDSKVSGRELKISLLKNYPKLKKIRLQVAREDGSVASKKHDEKVFTIRI